MGVWESMQEQLQVPAQNFISSFSDSLVAIIIVLLFFILGYIVASVIAYVIKLIFRKVDLNGYIKRMGAPNTFAGYTIESILILMVKVFIILAFLAAVTQLKFVNLSFITDILKSMIEYIPKLMQGFIIIVAAMIFAGYLSNIITKSKKIPLSGIIDMIIKIFIGYCAFVIALPLVLPNVDVTILTVAFQWLVAAIAIAFGLGLGIALGFSLRKPLEQAAENNPEMLDFFFGSSKKKK